MKITKNNYEAFFLDYHEGNLTPEQVADLLLFVEQNPELRDEFESFENITLDDFSNITFENKSELKKEINEHNQQEYFIRAVENALNATEQSMLENYLLQHPHARATYLLFQKTKLQSDQSVVFANKDALKKALTPAISVGNGNVGEALIALTEGLLSPAEERVLRKQIQSDSGLQKELALYQKAKLQPDTAIVFENKDALKRRERRVIPLYYYMAAAASILLMFGLYFMFNTPHPGAELANINSSKKPVQVATVVQPKALEKSDNKVEKKNTNTAPRAANGLVAKKSSHHSSPLESEIKESAHDKVSAPSLVNVMESTHEVHEPTNEIVEPVAKKENSKVDIQAPIANNQSPVKTDEYLSLTEMAVKKMKEATLNKEALAAEKKSGRLKKLNGWDIARVVAKGISKVTGRELKVEPHYNDDGDVTAYAFGAGDFEIKRAR